MPRHAPQLVRWCNEDLYLPVRVEAGEIERMFSDGYVFGCILTAIAPTLGVRLPDGLLQSLAASGRVLGNGNANRNRVGAAPASIPDMTSGSIATTDAKLSNFESLKPYLKAAGLKFDQHLIDDICMEQRGAATALLFQFKKAFDIATGAVHLHTKALTSGRDPLASTTSAVGTRQRLAQTVREVPLVNRLLLSGLNPSQVAMALHLAKFEEYRLTVEKAAEEADAAEDKAHLGDVRARQDAQAAKTMTRRAWATDYDATNAELHALELARMADAERSDLAYELTLMHADKIRAKNELVKSKQDAQASIAGFEASMRRMGMNPHGSDNASAALMATGNTASAATSATTDSSGTTASANTAAPEGSASFIHTAAGDTMKRGTVGSISTQTIANLAPRPPSKAAEVLLSHTHPHIDAVTRQHALSAMSTLVAGQAPLRSTFAASMAAEAAHREAPQEYLERMTVSFAASFRARESDVYQEEVNSRVVHARESRRDKATRGRLMGTFQAHASAEVEGRAAEAMEVVRLVELARVERAEAEAAFMRRHAKQERFLKGLEWAKRQEEKLDTRFREKAARDRIRLEEERAAKLAGELPSLQARKAAQAEESKKRSVAANLAAKDTVNLLLDVALDVCMKIEQRDEHEPEQQQQQYDRGILPLEWRQIKQSFVDGSIGDARHASALEEAKSQIRAGGRPANLPIVPAAVNGLSAWGIILDDNAGARAAAAGNSGSGGSSGGNNSTNTSSAKTASTSSASHYRVAGTTLTIEAAVAAASAVEAAAQAAQTEAAAALAMEQLEREGTQENIEIAEQASAYAAAATDAALAAAASAASAAASSSHISASHTADPITALLDWCDVRDWEESKGAWALTQHSASSSSRRNSTGAIVQQLDSNNTSGGEVSPSCGAKPNSIVHVAGRRVSASLSPVSRSHSPLLSVGNNNGGVVGSSSSSSGNGLSSSPSMSSLDGSLMSGSVMMGGGGGSSSSSNNHPNTGATAGNNDMNSSVSTMGGFSPPASPPRGGASASWQLEPARDDTQARNLLEELISAGIGAEYVSEDGGNSSALMKLMRTATSAAGAAAAAARMNATGEPSSSSVSAVSDDASSSPAPITAALPALVPLRIAIPPPALPADNSGAHAAIIAAQSSAVASRLATRLDMTHVAPTDILLAAALCFDAENAVLLATPPSIAGVSALVPIALLSKTPLASHPSFVEVKQSWEDNRKTKLQYDDFQYKNEKEKNETLSSLYHFGAILASQIAALQYGSICQRQGESANAINAAAAAAAVLSTTINTVAEAAATAAASIAAAVAASSGSRPGSVIGGDKPGAASRRGSTASVASTLSQQPQQQQVFIQPIDPLLAVPQPSADVDGLFALTEAQLLAASAEGAAADPVGAAMAASAARQAVLDAHAAVARGEVSGIAFSYAAAAQALLEATATSTKKDGKKPAAPAAAAAPAKEVGKRPSSSSASSVASSVGGSPVPSTPAAPPTLANEGISPVLLSKLLPTSAFSRVLSVFILQAQRRTDRARLEQATSSSPPRALQLQYGNSVHLNLPSGYGGLVLDSLPTCASHIVAIEFALNGPLLYGNNTNNNTIAGNSNGSKSMASLSDSHVVVNGLLDATSITSSGGGGGVRFETLPSEHTPKAWDGTLAFLLDALETGAWQLPSKIGSTAVKAWDMAEIAAKAETAARLAAEAKAKADAEATLQTAAAAAAASGGPPSAAATAGQKSPSGNRPSSQAKSGSAGGATNNKKPGTASKNSSSANSSIASLPPVSLTPAADALAALGPRPPTHVSIHVLISLPASVGGPSNEQQDAAEDVLVDAVTGALLFPHSLKELNCMPMVTTAATSTSDPPQLISDGDDQKSATESASPADIVIVPAVAVPEKNESKSGGSRPATSEGGAKGKGGASAAKGPSPAAAAANSNSSAPSSTSNSPIPPAPLPVPLVFLSQLRLAFPAHTAKKGLLESSVASSTLCSTYVLAGVECGAFAVTESSDANDNNGSTIAVELCTGAIEMAIEQLTYGNNSTNSNSNSPAQRPLTRIQKVQVALGRGARIDPILIGTTISATRSCKAAVSDTASHLLKSLRFLTIHSRAHIRRCARAFLRLLRGIPDSSIPHKYLNGPPASVMSVADLATIMKNSRTRAAEADALRSTRVNNKKDASSTSSSPVESTKKSGLFSSTSSTTNDSPTINTVLFLPPSSKSKSTGAHQSTTTSASKNTVFGVTDAGIVSPSFRALAEKTSSLDIEAVMRDPAYVDSLCAEVEDAAASLWSAAGTRRDSAVSFLDVLRNDGWIHDIQTVLHSLCAALSAIHTRRAEDNLATVAIVEQHILAPITSMYDRAGARIVFGTTNTAIPTFTSIALLDSSMLSTSSGGFSADDAVDAHGFVRPMVNNYFGANNNSALNLSRDDGGGGGASPSSSPGRGFLSVPSPAIPNLELTSAAEHMLRRLPKYSSIANTARKELMRVLHACAEPDNEQQQQQQQQEGGGASPSSSLFTPACAVATNAWTGTLSTVVAFARLHIGITRAHEDYLQWCDKSVSLWLQARNTAITGVVKRIQTVLRATANPELYETRISDEERKSRLQVLAATTSQRGGGASVLNGIVVSSGGTHSGQQYYEEGITSSATHSVQVGALSQTVALGRNVPSSTAGARGIVLPRLSPIDFIVPVNDGISEIYGWIDVPEEGDTPSTTNASHLLAGDPSFISTAAACGPVVWSGPHVVSFEPPTYDGQAFVYGSNNQERRNSRTTGNNNVGGGTRSRTNSRSSHNDNNDDEDADADAEVVNVNHSYLHLQQRNDYAEHAKHNQRSDQEHHRLALARAMDDADDSMFKLQSAIATAHPHSSSSQHPHPLPASATGAPSAPSSLLSLTSRAAKSAEQTANTVALSPSATALVARSEAPTAFSMASGLRESAHPHTKLTGTGILAIARAFVDLVGMHYFKGSNGDDGDTSSAASSTAPTAPGTRDGNLFAALSGMTAGGSASGRGRAGGLSSRSLVAPSLSFSNMQMAVGGNNNSNASATFSSPLRGLQQQSQQQPVAPLPIVPNEDAAGLAAAARTLCTVFAQAAHSVAEETGGTAEGNEHIPVSWVRAPSSTWQALSKVYARNSTSNLQSTSLYRWDAAALRRFVLALLFTRLRAPPTIHQLLLMRRNLSKADGDDDGFVTRAQFMSTLLFFQTAPLRASEVIHRQDLEAATARAAVKSPTEVEEAVSGSRNRNGELVAGGAAGGGLASSSSSSRVSTASSMFGGGSGKKASWGNIGNKMGNALAASAEKAAAAAAMTTQSARHAGAADGPSSSMSSSISPEMAASQGGARDMDSVLKQTMLASTPSQRYNEAAVLREVLWTLYCNAPMSMGGGLGGGPAASSHHRLDIMTLMLDLCSDPRSTAAVHPSVAGLSNHETIYAIGGANGSSSGGGGAGSGGGGGGTGGIMLPDGRATAATRRPSLEGALAALAANSSTGGGVGDGGVGDATVAGSFLPVAVHPGAAHHHHHHHLSSNSSSSTNAVIALPLRMGGSSHGVAGSGNNNNTHPTAATGASTTTTTNAANTALYVVGMPRVPGLLKTFYLLADSGERTRTHHHQHNYNHHHHQHPLDISITPRGALRILCQAAGLTVHPFEDTSSMRSRLMAFGMRSNSSIYTLTSAIATRGSTLGVPFRWLLLSSSGGGGVEDVTGGSASIMGAIDWLQTCPYGVLSMGSPMDEVPLTSTTT